MNAADRGHSSEFEALAVGWALCSLEPDDEERFTAHLTDCAHCHRVIDETHETLSELAYALPGEEPPPELRDRLRAAVDAEPQLAPQTAVQAPPGGGPRSELPVLRPMPARSEPDRPESHPGRGRHAAGSGPGRRVRPSRRNRLRTLVAAVAVLVVVAGLGVWNVALRNDRNHAQTTAQRYQSAVSSLMSPGARTARIDTTKGQPLATIVDRADKLTLVTVALARNNERSSTYVVWGLQSAKDTTPAPLGTFDVAHRDIDIQAMSPVSSTVSFPLYAVSKEPGRTAPSAPTDVLGSGALS